MKTCLAVSKNFPLVKQLFPKSTNLLENLLALETKLLLQIYLTQVALILTQVDSNPTQVEWNLAQVDLKMVLEVPEQFSSLLALCFHSTCVGFESTCVRNKATLLANIPNASDPSRF